MRIVAVTCTELFVGETEDPLQVVRVEVERPAGELRIAITGAGLSGSVTVAARPDEVTPPSAEVGVACYAAPGTVIPIRVTAETAAPLSVMVTVPGITSAQRFKRVQQLDRAHA